jgi:hypothetical protein
MKTYRKYAQFHRENMSIVSLDAKKAFDSVDHNYIKETLSRYGFSKNFIHIFDTIYNNNESSVLVSSQTRGQTR